MKTGVLLIALLFLAACAARPARCDRRLTPINTSWAAAHARRVGP